MKHVFFNTPFSIKLRQKSSIMNKTSLYCSIVSLIILVSCTQRKIADITIDKVSHELAQSTKTYDKLYEFHEGLSKVEKNGKIGFIDKMGKEIIKCRFDDASDIQYSVAIVKMGDKEGIIKSNGDEVTPYHFDYINSFGRDSLATASLDGKVGLIDVTGKAIIPFKYEEIGNFSEGLAAVRLNGRYGFIDKNGNIVISCMYDELYNGIGFSEGLVGVKKDGKWGYLDKMGNTVIPFKDGLTGSPFSSGLTTTYRGGISFSTDSKGNLESNEEPFEMAFINYNGSLASDFFPVQDLQGFRDGYCAVKDKNGWVGLLNTRGEFTVPCKYSFIANGFDENFVLIQINQKSGFARKSTGEIIIPCMYEIDYDGWKFNEGLIPVKKNGKYGFINEDNEVIIPFIYDGASSFSEGFAVVKKYGKYGFVDRYGMDTFNN